MDFQVLSQQTCRCQHKLGQHKLAQLQKQNSHPTEVQCSIGECSPAGMDSALSEDTHHGFLLELL